MRKGRGRRSFVAAVGATLGSLALPGLGRAVVPRREAGPRTRVAKHGVPIAPRQAWRAGDGPVDARSSFATLRAGDRVDRWTIAAIFEVWLGAVPIILETRGGVRFQVDVHRRDPRPGAPRGVCDTTELSIFLANRGDGRRVTDEEHGLGTMALGERLRHVEKGASDLPRLLTYEERIRKHPRGAYSVSLS